MSIIKCPRCSGNVSTMARTCPGCGTRIYGNITKCAHCNNYVSTEDECCPHCGNSLTREEGEPPTPAQPDSFATTTVTHKKGKKISTILFVLCAIVLVTGCGIAYFFYRQWRNEREAQAYTQVMHVTNPSLCQDFIEKYPYSPHREEVEKHMKALEAEIEEWKEVSKSPSRTNVYRFLQSHPESAFYKECSQLADSIDWREAKELCTEASVEAYINHHPNGTYLEQAMEMRNTLRRCRVTPQNVTMLRGLLELFFTNAFIKKNEKDTKECLANDSVTFCGKSGTTAATILKHPLVTSEKDVIGKHFMVEGTLEVTKTPSPIDGTLIYQTQCTMMETTNRSDVTKDISAKHHVQAEFDSNFKLTAIEIK
ncbi:MAG: zinc ribbon domain-containing protein [Bacteroidaceae bacterium]|nr:zinc ribbon domain-containing protein [Bacteroidaceae bacterium]